VKLNAPDIRGLLGVFLGDGFLSQSRSAVKGHIKATFHGGADEREFLEEKASEIKLVIPTQAKISTYQMRPSRTGHQTTVLRFRFSSPLLDPVYNLFYPDGFREITHPLLDILGLRAAAWLWAEGYRKGDKDHRLRRVGALRDEARLISGWLEFLTGAKSSVTGQSSRILPQLSFSSKDAEIVKEALLPYAPISRKHLFLPGEK
jgi:hypothetical protein